MADAPTVTVVINGDPVETANVTNDAVRLLVANLEGKSLEILQEAIVNQVMPAIKDQVGAAVSAIIADFQANGWPEISRAGELTGNKAQLVTIVTNLMLRAFGVPDVFDNYPDPASQVVSS